MHKKSWGKIQKVFRVTIFRAFVRDLICGGYAALQSLELPGTEALVEQTFLRMHIQFGCSKLRRLTFRTQDRCLGVTDDKEGIFVS